MQRILIGFIRAYQYLLSPIMGNACRFYPSCSHYGVEAIQTHGSVYGSYLTIKRILRCNPMCQGGLDPVPPASNKQSDIQREHS